ncbi:unnamed protein product, partial [Trichogramma brassicae]
MRWARFQQGECDSSFGKKSKCDKCHRSFLREAPQGVHRLHTRRQYELLCGNSCGIREYVFRTIRRPAFRHSHTGRKQKFKNNHLFSPIILHAMIHQFILRALGAEHPNFKSTTECNEDEYEPPLGSGSRRHDLTELRGVLQDTYITIGCFGGLKLFNDTRLTLPNCCPRQNEDDDENARHVWNQTRRCKAR